jgi:hypothetical protein
VSLHLARLIRSIPRLVFQDDPARLSQAYQSFSPSVIQVLLAEPNGLDGMVSRGDFIDTGDGMKCIEFNFTAHLGGWETAVLAEIHPQIPATARFLAAAGIDFAHTNTVRSLFSHAIARARALSGDGEVNTVIVVSPGDGILGSPVFRSYFSSEYAPACRAHGVAGEILICPYAELVPSRGQLVHAGKRIHVVVELSRENTSPAVYRCFKQGNLCLFNGPLGLILMSKLNIALLSEGAERGVFTGDDAAIIRRHVPWTRRVAPDHVTYEGERVYLPDLLIARRERLVLKEVLLVGGKGVALGKVTPAERWRELAEAALASGQWVVQEVLESRPYLYQNGAHGCSPHDVVWGPFVFGDRYGGVILRMQPKAAGGAVNLSLHATAGIVLEVPDRPADAGA